jgi:RNA-directed DNA polymerase
MSLPTPSETVGKLQTSLQTKAKAEPAFRFYALWDKVCRTDVLQEAYRRCRANAGAAGVDGETFGQIGSPTGLLARRAAWPAGGGRRGLARLFHLDSPLPPAAQSVRRISDGRMLHIIKGWLTAPVVEVVRGRAVQTTEARRTKRGTPQGGVISPLLANCYFRRFLLAWHSRGHRDQLDVHVVNYADDFVICCRPGNAEAAMTRMTALMTRLGLGVNATKTRIARLPEEHFDFLGYTVGRFYGKDGRPYVGTRPSRKSVKSLLRRIHARTTRQWYADEPESTVARLSSLIRGWCGYFDQGPVVDIYDLIRRYTERRVRRWLLRRAGRLGAGFAQIPDEFLYEKLGLFAVPRRRIDLPRAKV